MFSGSYSRGRGRGRGEGRGRGNWSGDAWEGRGRGGRGDARGRGAQSYGQRRPTAAARRQPNKAVPTPAGVLPIKVTHQDALLSVHATRKRLSSDHLDQIAQLLLLYPNCWEAVALNFAELTDDTLCDSAFFNAVLQSHVGSLELFGNKTGAATCEAISGLLQADECVLERLKVGDNEVGDGGTVALCTGLFSNRSLKQLHLGSNNVGDIGLTALATALRGNTTLRGLCLRQNSFGPDGMAALCQALAAGSPVQELQLKRNGIGHTGIGHLAQILVGKTCLRILELEATDLHDAGTTTLAAALAVNNTVIKVNLNDNNIGDVGAGDLGKMLQKNSTITALGLRNNSIREGGACSIADALRTNTTLTGVDMASNFVAAAGSEGLAGALAINQSVVCVNVRDNTIPFEGSRALAQAVLHNRTLTHIDISRNHTSDDGACEWAKVLQQNTTLTRLSLSENHISDVGAKALQVALQHNFTVRSLTLGGQSISHTVRNAIYDKVTVNKDKWTVEGGQQWVDEEDEDAPRTEGKATDIPLEDVWSRRLDFTPRMWTPKRQAVAGEGPAVGVASPTGDQAPQMFVPPPPPSRQPEIEVDASCMHQALQQQELELMRNRVLQQRMAEAMYDPTFLGNLGGPAVVPPRPVIGPFAGTGAEEPFIDPYMGLQNQLHLSPQQAAAMAMAANGNLHAYQQAQLYEGFGAPGGFDPAALESAQFVSALNMANRDTGVELSKEQVMTQLLALARNNPDTLSQLDAMTRAHRTQQATPPRDMSMMAEAGVRQSAVCSLSQMFAETANTKSWCDDDGVLNYAAKHKQTPPRPMAGQPDEPFAAFGDAPLPSELPPSIVASSAAAAAAAVAAGNANKRANTTTPPASLANAPPRLSPVRGTGSAPVTPPRGTGRGSAPGTPLGLGSPSGNQPLLGPAGTSAMTDSPILSSMKADPTVNGPLLSPPSTAPNSEAKSLLNSTRSPVCSTLPGGSAPSSVCSTPTATVRQQRQQPFSPIPFRGTVSCGGTPVGRVLPHLSPEPGTPLPAGLASLASTPQTISPSPLAGTASPAGANPNPSPHTFSGLGAPSLAASLHMRGKLGDDTLSEMFVPPAMHDQPPSASLNLNAATPADTGKAGSVTPPVSAAQVDAVVNLVTANMATAVESEAKSV